MKAVLEFDLPEDKTDFQAAIIGHNYKSAIWDFDQLLRSEMKYTELIFQLGFYELDLRID
jgi:hypothetical protein